MIDSVAHELFIDVKTISHEQGIIIDVFNVLSLVFSTTALRL